MWKLSICTNVNGYPIKYSFVASAYFTKVHYLGNSFILYFAFASTSVLAGLIVRKTIEATNFTNYFEQILQKEIMHNKLTLANIGYLIIGLKQLE